LPDNTTIGYASNRLGDEACAAVQELRTGGKFVWPIYDSFDIFTADLKGNILPQLTKEPGYDAEETESPKGDRMVFTSFKTGDLELYTMNLDRSDVKQITSDLGCEGGAFFSPHGTKLIWRAPRTKTESDIKEYKDLLSEGLVMPNSMELYLANADGTAVKKLTDLGKANWAPFFHPAENKIISYSNH